MRVLRVNKRLAAGLAGCVLLLLGLVALLSGSDSQRTSTRAEISIRNLQNRQIAEQDRSVNAGRKVIPAETEPGIEAIKEQERLNEEREEKEAEEELQKRVGELETENDMRKNKVVAMMKHAWYGYRNYSWGANEVKPIEKTKHQSEIFGGPELGATIVDAADTLWIMDLKEEYAQARDWIRDSFDYKTKATGSPSVFETTIRFLGGLLSLHALTGEDFYIRKAQDVGDALLPAFKTPTGIPHSIIDIKNRRSSNYGWANGGMSILAEIGSLHLEFAQLSKITKQPIFREKVQKVRDALDKAEKPDGMYTNYISQQSGKFGGNHISLGALGDSFYEYLIKSWIYSDYKDEQARRMYWNVSDKIQEKMVRVSRKSNLTYLVELRNGMPEHHMGHLACFSVGMFALEGHYEKNAERKAKVMRLAEELGRTCHESYVRSESQIGPEMFYFNGNEEATARHSGANGYILRPEVIEGFFYLHRLTGKQQYRDWVWGAVQAIEKHCKKPGGYAGLRNVYEPSQGSDDVQQSFFLAETLKYAFLTFTESSVISLDDWVFNTEAHPLPIDRRPAPRA